MPNDQLHAEVHRRIKRTLAEEVGLSAEQEAADGARRSPRGKAFAAKNMKGIWQRESHC